MWDNQVQPFQAKIVSKQASSKTGASTVQEETPASLTETAAATSPPDAMTEPSETLTEKATEIVISEEPEDHDSE